MPKIKDRPIPDAMSGFGQRLRVARKALGLSLDALATETGGDVAILSRAENGKRLPTLPETVRISEALGVRLGWLVIGEPPMAGRAVTILVEDDGPGAADVRSKILLELSKTAETPTPIRDKRANVRR